MRASCPNRRSAFGRAETTSPKPPVFAKGVHSEVIKSILKDGPLDFPIGALEGVVSRVVPKSLDSVDRLLERAFGSSDFMG